MIIDELLGFSYEGALLSIRIIEFMQLGLEIVISGKDEAVIDVLSELVGLHTKTKVLPLNDL